MMPFPPIATSIQFHRRISLGRICLLRRMPLLPWPPCNSVIQNGLPAAALLEPVLEGGYGLCTVTVQPLVSRYIELVSAGRLQMRFVPHVIRVHRGMLRND